MHLTLSTLLFGPQLLDDCHSISFYPYVVLPRKPPNSLSFAPSAPVERSSMSIPSIRDIPLESIRIAVYINEGRWPLRVRRVSVRTAAAKPNAVLCRRASFHGISAFIVTIMARVYPPRYWLTLSMQIRAIRSDDRRYVCLREREGKCKMLFAFA